MNRTSFGSVIFDFSKGCLQWHRFCVLIDVRPNTRQSSLIATTHMAIEKPYPRIFDPNSGEVDRVVAFNRSLSESSVRWQRRWPLRISMRFVISFLCLVCSMYAATADVVLQTFVLQEMFGVRHPDQVIDFDLSTTVDPANSYLLGPGGSEVPYQILSSNRVALRTSLSPKASVSWTLMSGRPPSLFEGGVQLLDKGDYYEVTNGLTGVRIPKATTFLQSTLAPVQGIQHKDGQWTALGPTYLSIPATNMAVSILENGPLVAKVQVDYLFPRADYLDRVPPRTPPEGVLYPAGQGHLTTVIELQSGQPSILMDEDTDMDLFYTLNVSNGLLPNQARYRGHHSTSVTNGYEATGIQYRNSDSRPSMDAFVDLRFDAPKEFRRLAVWDPWIFDSGWYWQLYNTSAPTNSNLLGIFAGKASTALGAVNSGVSLITEPLGIQNLITKVDPQGNLHSLYQNAEDVFYLKFGSALTAGGIELVGRNLANPEFAVHPDGTISVVSYDRSTGAFVISTRPPGGSFSSRIFTSQAPVGVQLTDRYGYLAATSSRLFFLTLGSSNGVAGGLLFSRATGITDFSFEQFFDMSALRACKRPCFETLADGRVIALFTQSQYAEFAVITNGASNFGNSASARTLFSRFTNPRHLNFGAALDSVNGGFVIADSTGSLTLMKPSGTQLAASETTTSLALSLESTVDGPNHRIAASAPTGEVVAIHNGRFFIFRSGAWSSLALGDNLGLVNARVHYHPPTSQFVFLGRKSGVLNLYGWKPTETIPRALTVVSNTAMQGAELKVAFNRATSDARFFPRVHINWGFFIGSKSNDLASPYVVQNIGKQMNLHGGLNLNKTYRYDLVFNDPSSGYGHLFMPSSVLSAMVTRLRQGDAAYKSYLDSAEPTARPLIAMWADSTGVQTHSVATNTTVLAASILDALVNGEGIYDTTYHYWHGGLAMGGRGVYIDSVLADSLTSPTDRVSNKASAALFASILWDEDFVPLHFELNGLNAGTANMPVQFVGYRQFYTLFLSEHPLMSPFVPSIRDQTTGLLQSIVNPAGAEIGSPHYLTASFIPTLNTLLQLKFAGAGDVFAQETRLGAFGKFHMNLMTPPDVRYGTRRKLVASGDGSTEGSEVPGQLSTGLRTVDPTLAEQLMGAWIQMGKVHSGFFSSTLLSIDESAPSRAPDLKTAHYDGYMSSLRTGVGTATETAEWLFNGDYYRDHRSDDRGSMVLYLLGAPVSLNWGCLYSPYVSGGTMKSIVVPSSKFAQWNLNDQPLTIPSGWVSSSNSQFLSFTTAGVSDAVMNDNSGLIWQRTLSSFHGTDSLPITVIRDSFSGSNAAAAKVFTVNLMAEGNVTVPTGTVTPPLRTYDSSSTTLTQLPSASVLFSLTPGLKKLSFVGQTWNTHVTHGVDWDLYTLSGETLSGNIGNWGHTWAPSAEANQFRTANGRGFEERQHILRLKGNQGLTLILVPWLKGQKPAGLQVTQTATNVMVTTASSTNFIHDTYFAYFGNGFRSLVSLSSNRVDCLGMGIIGGPGEVIVQSKKVSFTTHGPAGVRHFFLPASIRENPDAGVLVPVDVTDFAIDHKGGPPKSVVWQ